MATYRITVMKGKGTGIPGPEDGVYTVSATAPAVALKRLLDGGHQAQLKYATVGANRLELRRREFINLRIERI